MQMIIIQKGKCEKCGADFEPLDTVQSTNVECSKCKKQFIKCRNCKQDGCECGGKLLDAWDKNTGIIF